MSKYIILISVFVFIRINSFSQDTSGLKSVTVAYDFHNDDTGISNFRNYNVRRRDDFGLTLQMGLYTELKLKIFKKAYTNVKFHFYSGLFTRSLGSNSSLKKEDPDYGDYSYLAEKHPDWAYVYVGNQIALTKIVKQINFFNRYKTFGVSLSFKETIIDRDQDQFMIDVQRRWHRFLDTKNYYHKPFTDSTIFKEKNLKYYSISSAFAFFDTIIFRNNVDFNYLVEAGVWINSRNDYRIKTFSPYVRSKVMVKFGKSLTHLKRFHIGYEGYYEPRENLQLYANPGTYGYQRLHAEINLLSKKIEKQNSKKYLLVFTLTPYSIYFPIGLKRDHWLNYVPPEKDKKVIESYFQAAMSLYFK